jgi:hypothetical protein
MNRIAVLCLTFFGPATVGLRQQDERAFTAADMSLEIILEIDRHPFSSWPGLSRPSTSSLLMLTQDRGCPGQGPA